MPVWPKSFYTFGVNMKTAGTEWKLRKKTGARTEQDRAFRSLVDRLAITSFWKKAGIQRGMSYAQFQSRVPLHQYSDLAPAVDRMKRGEKDVLWPGQCSLFALTSGTTGEPKLLPVTEEMLAHVRRAGTDALLYYTVRVRNAGVFRGRHLMLGGSTDLAPIAGVESHPAYAGALSGIVAVDLPPWAEKHYYEPGPRVASNDDWDAKLAAIVERTMPRDISLIAGIPTWVIPLIEEVRGRGAARGQPIGHLTQLWPNLECLVHTGVPIKPFAKRLREALGPEVKFHEVYAASEGFLAAQDTEQGEAMRLMADMGLFFEFVPMSEFDPARLSHLGTRTIPLADVKIDTDYAVLVTTPAGLARYVLGDVIRFVSKEPPRLVYVGRTDLQLNACGEHVMEKDLTDTLVNVCTAQDWDIVNFHVAPLFGSPTFTGQNRVSHEWWIEIRPGTVSTPIGPQIAMALDLELHRIHAEYATRRKSGALDIPIVRLVMPGVFEHWLRYQKKWGGQHKIARCRSDRAIANELAQVTHFARD